MGARALAIIGITLLGCAGPDPQVERVEIVQPDRPGHVRVDLAIVNRSGGHGQVQVEIRLRSTSPVRTVAAERQLDLDDHERLELTVEIPAPDGKYIAEARALYPD